ncbi:glycosyltransferase [Priestia megaterium]|uniref:glycosyltransferase n=1 Tax=Priestia megaterium TaxID=1404 RepID=UPI0021AD4068|nr:glycosyltransferase [Priestia megaterium]MCR8925005.1 glycosyltransferase [Priestia megaterium]
MKKKIVFMVINMNVGGTEKALLNMISEIPKDKYDITILMLEKYGAFLDFIPTGVHIEYLKEYKELKDILNRPPKTVVINLFKKGSIISGLSLIVFHLISRFVGNRIMFFKYFLRNVPVLKNEYDIAVAYAGPMDLISYFVVNKINAKKKIQWIHFDITKIGFNKHFASNMYSEFDKIFVVSEEAKNKLVKVVPTLKEKSEVFLNIVSPDIIRIQSKEEEGFRDNFDGLRILTVGRLTAEKGQDLAIEVLARLIKNGYKVKWYCIGEGDSREKYEKLVEGYNLQNQFIFLGANPNPYPYIDQCDIYVQPSRYEGYCITLMEARALKKPIVTTDVNGTREQIIDGENGIIVNINEDEIYKGIEKLINNKELCNEFSRNLSNKSFNSAIQIKKLFNVF